LNTRILAAALATVLICHQMSTLASCDAIRLPSNLILLPLFVPLSSNRRYLSYDGCLEVRMEIIRTVLGCIVYWSHKHSYMSSSYSSLDLVLSHWAHLSFMRLSSAAWIIATVFWLICPSFISTMISSVSSQSKMPQQGSSSTWDVATTSLTRSSVSIGSACRSEFTFKVAMLRYRVHCSALHHHTVYYTDLVLSGCVVILKIFHWGLLYDFSVLCILFM